MAQILSRQKKIHSSNNIFVDSSIFSEKIVVHSHIVRIPVSKTIKTTMGNYIVSARKYRPDTFETVVAQKALTTTLKNAIQTGKLAHAYLFCGPRGVGKTTCARIFAKTINCEHPTANGEPCNSCESCLSFNQQRSFTIYELDAASNNSVEDIRMLNEQVRIPPQVGRYKVYIIDEVHMLTQAAFNAFLKTLEEPPAHAIFILATTEKHKIIPTILSRCQIYDFSRIDNSDIIAHLKSIADREGINSEYDALRIIAQKSDGCMRDALSLFDQMSSFTQGDLRYEKVIESLNILDYDCYFRFTEQILASETAQLMLMFNNILGRGFEGNIFIGGLASHFRDLLVACDPVTHRLLECGEELQKKYIEQAAKCTPRFLFKAIKLCTDCEMNYRASRNKRLLVELTIIQLSQINNESADEISGRSPKRLKPIFNKIEENGGNTENTPLPRPAAPVAAKMPEAPAKAPEPTKTEQTPAQPVVLSGRPESLKRSNNGATPFGGMFQRTHRNIAQESRTETSQQEEKTAGAARAEEKRVSLTSESLSQKWMEYALRLPENERALADRMKIISPELTGDNQFTIKVGNKLVMEFFEKEAKAITGYIAEQSGCSAVSRKIEIDEQQQRRRIYDRTEQFKMLTEKNPAIEKLQKNLNLDFA